MRLIDERMLHPSLKPMAPPVALWLLHLCGKEFCLRILNCSGGIGRKTLCGAYCAVSISPLHYPFVKVAGLQGLFRHKQFPIASSKGLHTPRLLSSPAVEIASNINCLCIGRPLSKGPHSILQMQSVVEVIVKRALERLAISRYLLSS